MFRIILTVVLTSINRLVFVAKTQNVLCEIKPAKLHDVWANFKLQRSNTYCRVNVIR